MGGIAGSVGLGVGVVWGGGGGEGEMKKSQHLHQKSKSDLPGPLRSPKWTSSQVIALNFHVEFDGRTPGPSNHQKNIQKYDFPQIYYFHIFNIFTYFTFSYIFRYLKTLEASPREGLKIPNRSYIYIYIY